MYVCICNALKDKDLTSACSGARTVADVFKKCGRRPQCGKCLPDVANMIEAGQPTSASVQKIAAE